MPLIMEIGRSTINIIKPPKFSDINRHHTRVAFLKSTRDKNAEQESCSARGWNENVDREILSSAPSCAQTL